MQTGEDIKSLIISKETPESAWKHICFLAKTYKIMTPHGLPGVQEERTRLPMQDIKDKGSIPGREDP